MLEARGAPDLALAGLRLPRRLACWGHGRSSIAGPRRWQWVPNLAVASHGQPPLSSSGAQDHGSGSRCWICPLPGRIWRRLCPMHDTHGVASLALDGMGLAVPEQPSVSGLPGSWLLFPYRPPSLPVANHVWPPLSGGLGWGRTGQRLPVSGGRDPDWSYSMPAHGERAAGMCCGGVLVALPLPSVLTLRVPRVACINRLAKTW